MSQLATPISTTLQVPAPSPDQGQPPAVPVKKALNIRVRRGFALMLQRGMERNCATIIENQTNPMLLNRESRWRRDRQVADLLAAIAWIKQEAAKGGV